MKNCSTTHALIHMIHNRLAELENPGSTIRCCMIDFSKVFDRIDHNILLHKLQQLNIPPILLNWCAEFLHDRYLRVKLGQNKSTWRQINAGLGKTWTPLLPCDDKSLISKVLERCVFNNIKYHIYQQISPCHNGFIPGKSCITQLVEVLEHIGRELDRGKQTDVLYLDMSKAFDKVSHNQLLHRLRAFGFEGSILKWFASYLTNRYQQTTVLGATSRSLPVTSGVPQGSILGPLLFLLYENYLSNAVTKSKIATFADDTEIFRTIYSSFDASLLQNDLSSFEESSTKINLALNVTKCEVLRVTRKQNKIIYPYKLHDTILESTDCAILEFLLLRT